MSLTKHPSGSLRELWSLSFPLMLSSLSLMMMLFVDRMMLANYSSEALTAAVSASTFGWAFVCAFTVIASISEVFVAQYNGAGLKEKLSEPVWQMIWFSLGSTLLFIPFGWWGGSFIFPNQPLEGGYFKWMMVFGASYPLYGALCGFFIGKGQTRIISWLAVGANIVNACLDYILIYGVEGFIPSYGVEGAAIATSGSSIFQLVILGSLFLNKKNRKEYRTDNWTFHWPSFKQCLKVALPAGIFCGCEIGGWAAYYFMMAEISSQHLVIASITQSLCILCFFFPEGLNKGAAAVVGNLIGAKQSHLVWRVLRNGMILAVLFSLAILGIYFCFNDFLVESFLRSSHAEGTWTLSLDQSLRTCLLFSICYIFFEAIRQLLTGLLTAAGDTRFLLIGGLTATWLFLALPIYLLVVRVSAPIEHAAFICTAYCAAASLVYFARFYLGRWKKMSIIETEPVANQILEPL